MSNPAADRREDRATESIWPAGAAILVVLLMFVLRVPGYVQPMGPDQGVYATIGWALHRGLALYRDLWEQKPPAIYLTYFVGFGLFGARPATIFVMEYVAAAVATVALFDLGRRMVSVRFGALTAAVYAVATFPAARHALGGFLERSVTETFIIPLAVLAAWATVVGLHHERRGWWILSGLLIGCAATFKQTALIYWPAFALWIWWMSGTSRAISFGLSAGGGVVIAPAAAIAWLWQQGVLQDAWVAVVSYPVAYLALGDSGVFTVLDRLAHEVWRRMKTDEIWALGCLGAAVALARFGTWRRSKAGGVAALAIVWLAAAQVALFANGARMFVTYFLPSLVPLSLLIAWIVHEIASLPSRRRMATGLLLAAFAAFMLARSNSIRKGVRMTAWDLRHATGQTTRDEYLQIFRSSTGAAFSAIDNERLAAYIHDHTAAEDRIFVFGMSAGAYFSSGRLPASRFVFVYPAVSRMIDRPEFRIETLAAELMRNRPAYVVLQRGNGDRFSGWRAVDSFGSPPMQQLLAAYSKETEIGGFDLYSRKDQKLENVAWAASASTGMNSVGR